MKKLKQPQINQLCRDMNDQCFSVWRIAKRAGVSPRWAREIYKRYLQCGVPPTPRKCGRPAIPTPAFLKAKVIREHGELPESATREVKVKTTGAVKTETVIPVRQPDVLPITDNRRIVFLTTDVTGVVKGNKINLNAAPTDFDAVAGVTITITPAVTGFIAPTMTNNHENAYTGVLDTSKLAIGAYTLQATATYQSDGSKVPGKNVQIVIRQALEVKAAPASGTGVVTAGEPVRLTVEKPETTASTAAQPSLDASNLKLTVGGIVKTVSWEEKATAGLQWDAPTSAFDSITLGGSPFADTSGLEAIFTFDKPGVQEVKATDTITGAIGTATVAVAPAEGDKTIVLFAKPLAAAQDLSKLEVGSEVYLQATCGVNLMGQAIEVNGKSIMLEENHAEYYSATWKADAVGTYQLKATGYDAGTKLESKQTAVTVVAKPETEMELLLNVPRGEIEVGEPVEMTVARLGTKPLAPGDVKLYVNGKSTDATITPAKEGALTAKVNLPQTPGSYTMTASVENVKSNPVIVEVQDEFLELNRLDNPTADRPIARLAVTASKNVILETASLKFYRNGKEMTETRARRMLRANEVFTLNALVQGLPDTIWVNAYIAADGNGVDVIKIIAKATTDDGRKVTSNEITLKTIATATQSATAPATQASAAETFAPGEVAHLYVQQGSEWQNIADATLYAEEPYQLQMKFNTAHKNYEEINLVKLSGVILYSSIEIREAATLSTLRDTCTDCYISAPDAITILKPTGTVTKNGDSITLNEKPYPSTMATAKLTITTLTEKPGYYNPLIGKQYTPLYSQTISTNVKPPRYANKANFYGRSATQARLTLTNAADQPFITTRYLLAQKTTVNTYVLKDWLYWHDRGERVDQADTHNFGTTSLNIYREGYVNKEFIMLDEFGKVVMNYKPVTLTAAWQSADRNFEAKFMLSSPAYTDAHIYITKVNGKTLPTTAFEYIPVSIRKGATSTTASREVMTTAITAAAKLASVNINDVNNIEIRLWEYPATTPVVLET